MSVCVFMCIIITTVFVLNCGVVVKCEDQIMPQAHTGMPKDRLALAQLQGHP